MKGPRKRRMKMRRDVDGQRKRWTRSRMKICGEEKTSVKTKICIVKLSVDENIGNEKGRKMKEGLTEELVREKTDH